MIKSLIWSLLGFLAIVVYQHVAKIVGFRITPSYLISYSNTAVGKLFMSIGKILALISSFPKYIHLEELFNSIIDIIKPTSKLLFSWTKIFIGYCQTIIDFKFPTYVTIIGSVTIELLSMLTIMWLAPKYSLFKKLESIFIEFKVSTYIGLGIITVILIAASFMFESINGFMMNLLSVKGIPVFVLLLTPFICELIIGDLLDRIYGKHFTPNKIRKFIIDLCSSKVIEKKENVLPAREQIETIKRSPIDPYRSYIVSR